MANMFNHLSNIVDAQNTPQYLLRNMQPQSPPIVIDPRNSVPIGDMIIRGDVITPDDELRAKLTPLNLDKERNARELAWDWKIAQMYGQVGPAMSTRHVPELVEYRTDEARRWVNEDREARRARAISVGPISPTEENNLRKRWSQSKYENNLSSRTPDEFSDGPGWGKPKVGPNGEPVYTPRGWFSPQGGLQKPVEGEAAPGAGDVWVSEDPTISPFGREEFERYRNGLPAQSDVVISGKPTSSLPRVVRHESGHRVTLGTRDGLELTDKVARMIKSGKIDTEDPIVKFTLDRIRNSPNAAYDTNDSSVVAAELLADAWDKMPELRGKSPYYPTVGPPVPPDSSVIDTRTLDQILQEAAGFYSKRYGVPFTHEVKRPKVHSGYDQSGLPYHLDPGERYAMRNLLLGYGYQQE